MGTLDLFAGLNALAPREIRTEGLGDGAVVLRGRASAAATSLLAAIEALTAQAPFRHMTTPGGQTMSAALTNTGRLGWVSDGAGYRYQTHDPESGLPWPPLPGVFRTLATEAAADAGFHGFQPDACLVNRYVPGARMTLHQDRNEEDFTQPIVSVSLGLPIVFLWGGLHRKEPPRKVPLDHGDVAVWGGPARLRYHGVLALPDGEHPLTGRCRINLTFRRAGPAGR